MKIGIAGTGYVGLVLGGCLCAQGHEAFCVDTHPEYLNLYRDGKIPFFEPGLETLIREGLQKNRLSFHSHLSEVLPIIDLLFISVGTPPLDNGAICTEAIFQICTQVNTLIQKKLLIV